MTTQQNSTMRPRPDKPAAPINERERRIDVRVAVRVSIFPLSTHCREIYGWVQNLSQGGMYVKTAELLPSETECRFRLTFNDGTGTREVYVAGWTVYSATDGMGIQFDLMPEDAREVLEQLDHSNLQPAA
ncbi:MAG: PilZ domain-containing protein [Leptospirillia bacterium]